VVMNGEIHAAREVQKEHLQSLDVLTSRNRGQLGSVAGKEITFHHRRNSLDCEYAVSRPVSLPPVGIIYSHVGQDAGVVKYFSDAGYAGIVLAGVGQGNANDSVISALAAGVVEN